MNSSLLSKYESKIVRISALYCGTVQGKNPYNIWLHNFLVIAMNYSNTITAVNGGGEEWAITQYPPRFWQNKRHLRAVAARLITTCLPIFE